MNFPTSPALNDQYSFAGKTWTWNGGEWDKVSSALSASSIPDLDISKIVSGILGTARGGTGIGAYTTGGYLYASGTNTLAQHTPAQVLVDIGGVGFDRYGASSTSGTLDWNDASNARPGSGYTLMRGSDSANAPPANSTAAYFHSWSIEYGTAHDGTGQMTQFAMPYANTSGASEMFVRGRYSGAWGPWVEIWTSYSDGAGSGMDADLLDGQQGSYYSTITNMTGTLAIANGGTGQTTATAAFDALNPTTTLGDISYRGASASARLAGNITSVKQYLSQTGTGSVSAIPVWATIAVGDVTGALAAASYTAADVLAKILTVDGSGSGLDADLLDGQNGSYYLSAANLTGTLAAARSWALTGDVTSPAGSAGTTIANSAVTLAKMANIATGTLLGRSSAGTGAPEVLTLGSGLSLISGVLSSTGGGGGTFTTGISFGSNIASSATDLSKHIALYGSSYGFSVTSSMINYVSGGAIHNFIDATGTGAAITARTMTVTGNLNCGGNTTLGPAGAESHWSTTYDDYFFFQNGSNAGYYSNSNGYLIQFNKAANSTNAVGPLSSSARIYVGYDAGVANAISCSAWFRSNGSTGWYSTTYGGGVYMTDTTYVRAYNGTKMAAADFVIVSDIREKTGVRDFEFKGRLSPKNFSMIKTGVKDFGFIAQEVQELYPEAVDLLKDSDRLQLSYGKLTAIVSFQVNRLEDVVEVIKRDVGQNKEETIALKAELADVKNTMVEQQVEISEMKSELADLRKLVMELLSKS